MSAVEHGFYNATANKRMRELEERQSELDRLIIIERSKMQVKVSAEEIRAFYEAALLQESQMLINYLVREIIVYDNEIQIYFKSPLQTSPDNSQGFSLYTGVGNLQHKLPNKPMLENIKMKIEIYIG